MHLKVSIFSLIHYRNRISRDGAFCIAKLLKQNTPLEHLNLAYNRIEDHGAEYISEALATANSNLTTLVLFLILVVAYFKFRVVPLVFHVRLYTEINHNISNGLHIEWV